jgi:hypothetical protein
MAQNHKESTENEEIQRNGIEERTDPKRPASVYIEHKVDENSEQGNTPSMDLGEYYIARTQEAMEEWNSKYPRDGYHVTDVCGLRKESKYYDE